MLKSKWSLRSRAALTFVSIYLATFATGLGILSAKTLSVDGESHHSGPDVAIALAAEEMIGGDRVQFPTDGSLAALARRNPSFWLLVQSANNRFSYGPVPQAAFTLFNRNAGVVEIGKFHVPGVARPLSDAALETFHEGGDVMVIATGGVDPTTISFAQSLRYFFSQGLFVIVLLLGLLGLTAMLIALPFLTRTLRKLAAEAATIDPAHPARRINEGEVPQELLGLVRGFNSALDRLSNELLRRKRFIADVAHELRTPLAIASLQTEALPESPSKSDLQRVITRMSHLVSQMLDVERLSLAGQQRHELDLAALTRDVVAEVAPLALSAGYEISFDAPPTSVTVTGDPHSLTGAISNLIGNAIVHGHGEGQIRVIVSESRTVDVIDEGPGIPAAIRDALFEPFCRNKWDRDGCGLGLYLTREIMRAHGGDAVLLDGQPGAAFRLIFP